MTMSPDEPRTMDCGRWSAGPRTVADEQEPTRRDRPYATAAHLRPGRCVPTRDGVRVRMAARAADRRGPGRSWPGGASELAAVRSRPVAAGGRPPGPHRAARTAGPGPRAGTRAHPVRPDARLA